jgi:hypothetical protein
MKAYFFFFSLFLSEVLIAQNTFSRTYADTFRMTAVNKRVIELPDSSYMIAVSGIQGSVAGSYCRILNVDRQGEVIRDKFEYVEYSRFNGRAQLLQAQDGNFILADSRLVNWGIATTRLTVQKFNAVLSDTLWSFINADSTEFDIGADLKLCFNNDIVLLASRNLTNSPDSLQTLFIRLSDTGILLSKKIYSFTNKLTGYGVVELPDGTFLIGGSKQDEGEPLHGILFKVDSLGNLLWQRDYTQLIAGGLSLYDSTSVLLSGYVPAASSRPRLLRLNVENGDIIFDKQNNYTQSALLYISRKVSNGEIFSVGLTSNTTESNSGFYMRCDSMGNPIYLRRVNYLNEVDFFIDFIETSDGGILINGAAADTPEDGGQNLWLVKLDSMGCLEPNCWVGVEQTQANTLGVAVCPNPATDWLYLKYDNTHKITLEIFNLSGQRVLQHQHMAPKEGIEISHLPAGLYLLRFVDEQGNVATEKIVVER